jgi:8-oxo-dGTP pyrophosphatase MutT (NUDIX family)
MRFVIIAGEEDHKAALERTGFWGQEAAGCLFLAKDTGRILFARRSKNVLSPNTYGTWGGAIDRGESPEKAVRREVEEESGYAGTFALKFLILFKHSSGFQYFNYLAIVPTEFEPELDWETSGYKWVTFGQWPRPLHSGVKFLLANASNKIKKYVDKYS